MCLGMCQVVVSIQCVGWDVAIEAFLCHQSGTEQSCFLHPVTHITPMLPAAASWCAATIYTLECLTFTPLNVTPFTPLNVSPSGDLEAACLVSSPCSHCMNVCAWSPAHCRLVSSCRRGHTTMAVRRHGHTCRHGHTPHHGHTFQSVTHIPPSTCRPQCVTHVCLSSQAAAPPAPCCRCAHAAHAVLHAAAAPMQPVQRVMWC